MQYKLLVLRRARMHCHTPVSTEHFLCELVECNEMVTVFLEKNAANSYRIMSNTNTNINIRTFVQ